MDKIWHRGVIMELQAPWCYQISAEKGLAPKDIHAGIVAMMLQLYKPGTSGQLKSRGVGRALKMIQGPDVLPQPPPKKASTL